MCKSLALFLGIATLAAAPAFAGDLTFENGKATWHSTQCMAPNPPPALTGASSESSGEQMNTLVSQHNAYVDAAQVYMNCISNEAQRDQEMVNQQITAGAQRAIVETQDTIQRDKTLIDKRK